MDKLFEEIIVYDGPLPGKTAVSQTQIIQGLKATYIQAATKKINKPQIVTLFDGMMKDRLRDNGRLPKGLAPRSLKAAWQYIKPETISLSPEISMTLNKRLLALLAHRANPSPVSNLSSPPNGVLTKGHYAHNPILDPYNMAWATIDRAVGKLVAAGVDPDQVALAANFSLENRYVPEQLGALVRCVQGCFDTAVCLKTPFITSQEAEPLSGDLLHVLAMGLVPQGSKKVTAALQQAGNFIFVVGDSRAELGGSLFNQAGGRAEGSRTVPKPVPESLQRMQTLHKAMRAGLVQACRACGAGGIAVALAEMCLVGSVGLELQLIHVPRDWHAAYSADPVILFTESLSRFLVEVCPENAGRFRAMMGDVPHECVAVIGGEKLMVNGRIGQPILNLTLADMMRAAF